MCFFKPRSVSLSLKIPYTCYPVFVYYQFLVLKNLHLLQATSTMAYLQRCAFSRPNDSQWKRPILLCCSTVYHVNCCDSIDCNIQMEDDKTFSNCNVLTVRSFSDIGLAT